MDSQNDQVEDGQRGEDGCDLFSSDPAREQTGFDDGVPVQPLAGKEERYEDLESPPTHVNPANGLLHRRGLINARREDPGQEYERNKKEDRLFEQMRRVVVPTPLDFRNQAWCKHDVNERL